MEAALQELNLRELNLQDWASANPSLSPQRQAPSGGCLCLQGACGCIYEGRFACFGQAYRTPGGKVQSPAPKALTSAILPPQRQHALLCLPFPAPTSRPRAPIPAPKAPDL